MAGTRATLEKGIARFAGRSNRILYDTSVDTLGGTATQTIYREGVIDIRRARRTRVTSATVTLWSLVLSVLRLRFLANTRGILQQRAVRYQRFLALGLYLFVAQCFVSG